MNAIKKMPANCVESNASFFWLDDDGILVIVNKAKTLHDEADAEEGILIVRYISAGIPRPLLIDMTDVKSMSREAREIYAKESTERRVKAVGLVTRSAVSRIIGNFFLSFNRTTVPTKLFRETEPAKKWLLSYV